MEDKDNFDNADSPAIYDDSKTSESNNEVGVQVYALDGETIIKLYHGNNDYLLNDRIYLLIIENEEKSHYIYIKHIDRLLHTNIHFSGANKIMCPYYEKMICTDDFDKNHNKYCYKQITEEGTLIQLPEKEV